MTYSAPVYIMYPIVYAIHSLNRPIVYAVFIGRPTFAATALLSRTVHQIIHLGLPDGLCIIPRDDFE